MANWKAVKIDIHDLLTEDDSDENAQYVGKEIARRLRESIPKFEHYMARGFETYQDIDVSDIEEIADGFEYVDDCDELNCVLNDLYNYADAHLIWINTMGL